MTHAGDPVLGFSCLAALGVVVGLIAALRLAPFLAIAAGAALFAALAGVPAARAIHAFQSGAGAILGTIGFVIAFGAVLGAVMQETGAAGQVVASLLGRARPRALPWLAAGSAMLIGLPLFFEVGLVITVPIVAAAAARARVPVLAVGIPVLAGMTTLHALVPPHPGPLVAIAALHAPLGLTLGLGLLLAVPAVALAGPLYARLLVPHLLDRPVRLGHDAARTATARPPPRPALAVAVLLLPVVLMLGRTVADLALRHGTALARALDLVGEPEIALAVTALVALAVLGWWHGHGRSALDGASRRGLSQVATLLLTIGAGGGLKQVLVEGGVAGMIGRLAGAAHLPAVLLAWIVAAALRQATGSATVATVTTSGLLAPLVLGAHLPPFTVSVLVLAIGAGSVFFCHVNDAGFWMVREFFGLELGDTVLVWSVLQTIVSLTGLAGALLLVSLA